MKGQEKAPSIPTHVRPLKGPAVVVAMVSSFLMAENAAVLIEEPVEQLGAITALKGNGSEL